MMKCPACGAEVADGSKNCAKCGAELSMTTRAMGGTKHVAAETGAVAGKLGHGLVGGVKGFASGAKKGFNKGGSDKSEEETKVA
ncbi:MAG: zinc ribbon domain-containing protein [Thermoplasmata archaeon]